MTQAKFLENEERLIARLRAAASDYVDKADAAACIETEAADALVALLGEKAAMIAERDQIAEESFWWKQVIGEGSPSSHLDAVKHLHTSMVKPIYAAHRGTDVGHVIAVLIYKLALIEDRERCLVGYANELANGLEAELSAARAGLKFYADESDWRAYEHDEQADRYDRQTGSKLGEDRGLTARRTLAAITGGEEGG